MANEPENLPLVFLRRLEAKMDAIGDRLGDVELRLTNLEHQVGSLVATEAGHYASLSSRLDKLERRMERVEKRLDLLPAS